MISESTYTVITIWATAELNLRPDKNENDAFYRSDISVLTQGSSDILTREKK